jgi:hypothetical protein
MSKTIIKTSIKKSQKVVRLTIDDRLQAALVKYQDKYPLLSTVELIKVILSEGLKKQNSGFSRAVQIIKQREKNGQVIDGLTEDEQFALLEKYDLM